VSLRVRLLGAVIAVALAALLAADLATYSALRASLLRRIDQALEAVHPQIERAVDGSQAVNPNEVLAIAPGVYIQVREAAGEVLVDGRLSRPGGATGRPALPDDVGVPPRNDSRSAAGGDDSPSATGVDDNRAAAGGDDGTAVSGGGEPHRFFTVSGDGGPSYRVRGSRLAGGDQLFLALPLDEAAATLQRLAGIEAAVTGIAILAAGLIGWWLVGVGLRPLRAVERTAQAIAAGNLAERVPGAEKPTEVGHLAAALNAMLANIASAFAQRDGTEAALRRSEERLRRFVADASHELRTPLAAVSAYTELMERAGEHHPDDVARARAAIRRETVRMGRLVDDLLLLARLDEGVPLERRPIDIVALAGEAVEAHRAVAPEWPVQLRAAQPLEVLGDPVRLRQVLDNLLANVRAHTPPGTSAAITVHVAPADRSSTDAGTVQGAEDVVVTVADRGPGLAGAEATRMFERFYRADPSRSRARGGSGLGLAIVESICAAHGGSAHAEATPGGGFTVVVRLPGVPARRPPVTGDEPRRGLYETPKVTHS
jgi:two-component system OmpR family sensor kinase